VAHIALVHDVAGVAAVQARLLRGAGHDVDEIPLSTFGARLKWPAKALALPLRLSAYLPAVSQLRRERYDVVHIHWLANGIVGVLAGGSFFAQAHGSDVHRNLANPLYRWVSRSVLRDARAVFYVTPNLSAYMNEYREKLVYLPNPVDVDELSAPAPARVSRVLIFTRLDPIKGVDRIFPAVERLSNLVEVSALDWGPLANQYVRDYQRWVHFEKTVPHAEVGDFLGRFDLVIGQMKQGILSLMEIEALGSGRPLITGIDSSLYLEDPPPVIAASDADAIAAAVEKLRDDPAEVARLSREGRDWVVRNHGYSHHLRLLEAAYFGPAARP
jgi:glycosyltransferase involved in cell wall biosynthesis